MPEQKANNAGSAGRKASQPIWKRWLNYQSIVRQVPFFLFLALLAVIYIYLGHYADKQTRKINRLTKEVKELRYEYIAIKGRVLKQGKFSELVKSEAIQQLGLKEMESAPVVLQAETATAEKN